MGARLNSLMDKLVRIKSNLELREAEDRWIHKLEKLQAQKRYRNGYQKDHDLNWIDGFKHSVKMGLASDLKVLRDVYAELQKRQHLFAKQSKHAVSVVAQLLAES